MSLNAYQFNYSGCCDLWPDLPPGFCGLAFGVLSALDATFPLAGEERKKSGDEDATVFLGRAGVDIAAAIVFA